jgi:diacylglycerol kinase (ATP)
MRVCLYCNRDAGGGISFDELSAAITNGGHTIEHVVEDVADLVTDPAQVDCVVAAGGDGTVARAGRALAGGEMPLAIVPLGTANNIGRSLDIPRQLADTVKRWHERQVVKIDVGVLDDGRTTALFLESVGAGLVTSCIDEGRRTLSKDDPDSHLDRARRMYIGMVRRLRPRRYRLTLDAEEVEGDFLLVEALNTPSIGPSVELTADVNAADGFLSVVVIDDSERPRLETYLESLLAGGTAHAGFKSWRVKQVEIDGVEKIHVDDQVVAVETSPIRISIRACVLPLLA